MLNAEVIDKCLTFKKYDELEAYISNFLGDSVPLLIKFETEVWQKIRGLDLEQEAVGYARWDPYVKDYVIAEISSLKSASDCLISMLRIIYYKKGDFHHSWVSF